MSASNQLINRGNYQFSSFSPWPLYPTHHLLLRNTTAFDKHCQRSQHASQKRCTQRFPKVIIDHFKLEVTEKIQPEHKEDQKEKDSKSIELVLEGFAAAAEKIKIRRGTNERAGQQQK